MQCTGRRTEEKQSEYRESKCRPLGTGGFYCRHADMMPLVAGLDGLWPLLRKYSTALSPAGATDWTSDPEAAHSQAGWRCIR